MAGQRRACGLAEPVDDVEHTGRQLRLREHARQQVAVSGDHSAGLSTTVLPAASAGAIRHVDNISGAFQGMISPATPIGLRIV